MGRREQRARKQRESNDSDVMSTHDLRDKLDGLTHGGRMDSVYPESMSLLHRGLGVSKAE